MKPILWICACVLCLSAAGQHARIKQLPSSAPASTDSLKPALKGAGGKPTLASDAPVMIKQDHTPVIKAVKKTAPTKLASDEPAWAPGTEKTKKQKSTDEH